MALVRVTSHGVEGNRPSGRLLAKLVLLMEDIQQVDCVTFANA